MQFTEIFKQAKYIAASKKYYFPYIRKKFFIEKTVKKATLNVSVLGFCELYINGEKITDNLYITPYTHYNKPDKEDSGVGAEDRYFEDELSYTIAVSQFDVEKYLRIGINTFGLILAGGWYRSERDKHNGYRNFGKTKACFNVEVEYIDGSVDNFYSDEDCKWTESFLIRSGIFHEEQDLRKEIKDFSNYDYCDDKWNSVEVVDAPNSKYIINDCPPNKVIRWVNTTLVKRTACEVVFDVGENLTGYPVIKSCLPAGEKITVTHSEVLDDDGSVNEFHAYAQKTTFITDGRDEYHLRFTWHGFRYISISSTSCANGLSCEKIAVVHADINNTSEFECDNDVINWIYKTYINTQLTNYQCGVPTDCPQIERKGYTGDGQLLCDVGMMLFDSQKLYKKWLNDISDVQDRKTGFVHHTAPCFIGCSGGPAGWGGAIIRVPYVYYKNFGDVKLLERFYPQMLKYIEFMNNETVNGLISIHKRRGTACLGDWSSPKKPNHLPQPFVNTCMYISMLYEMVEIAEVCGFNSDIEDFNTLIKGYGNAVNAEYFDKTTGDYCSGEQGANAFAIIARLGDERTRKNLDRRYSQIKAFDTGIFATKYLPKTLFDLGYSDTAIELYTSTDKVSFNSWIKDGATTLYESWLDTRSLNHPMFGSVVEYLFTDVLGIKQVGCKYKKVIISPKKIKILQRVSGSILTVSGRISVSYKKIDGNVSFEINIPNGVDAQFDYGENVIALKAGRNAIIIKE